MDNPPAYAPPEGPYYMADLPYGVPPPGYYGWMPSTTAFPDAPPRKYNIYERKTIICFEFYKINTLYFMFSSICL